MQYKDECKLSWISIANTLKLETAEAEVRQDSSWGMGKNFYGGELRDPKNSLKGQGVTPGSHSNQNLGAGDDRALCICNLNMSQYNLASRPKMINLTGAGKLGSP